MVEDKIESWQRVFPIRYMVIQSAIMGGNRRNRAKITREIMEEMLHTQTGENEQINIITSIKNRTFNELEKDLGIT